MDDTRLRMIEGNIKSCDEKIKNLISSQERLADTVTLTRREIKEDVANLYTSFSKDVEEIKKMLLNLLDEEDRAAWIDDSNKSVPEIGNDFPDFQSSDHSEHTSCSMEVPVVDDVPTRTMESVCTRFESYEDRKQQIQKQEDHKELCLSIYVKELNHSLSGKPHVDLSSSPINGYSKTTSEDEHAKLMDEDGVGLVSVTFDVTENHQNAGKELNRRGHSNCSMNVLKDEVEGFLLTSDDLSSIARGLSYELSWDPGGSSKNTNLDCCNYDQIDLGHANCSLEVSVSSEPIIEDCRQTNPVLVNRLMKVLLVAVVELLKRARKKLNIFTVLTLQIENLRWKGNPWAEMEVGNSFHDDSKGIVSHLLVFENGLLVLGGVGRYFNKEAAQLTIKIAAGNGVGKILVGQEGILSTHAVSATIRKRNVNGGFIMSTSQNSGEPEYDWGIKFNYSCGQPAPESITDKIYGNTLSISEIKMADIPDADLSSLEVTKFRNLSVEVVDPVSDYLKLLDHVFDFPVIKSLLSRADYRFIFDAMHAVKGAYAKSIFVEKLGASLDSICNGVPLEDFGHGHPDPNLTYAKDLVNIMCGEKGPDFGVASDGDGDRNMILGRAFFVTPSDSVAIIAANAQAAITYFKGGPKGLARSMLTSSILVFDPGGLVQESSIALEGFTLSRVHVGCYKSIPELKILPRIQFSHHPKNGLSRVKILIEAMVLEFFSSLRTRMF